MGIIRGSLSFDWSQCSGCEGWPTRSASCRVLHLKHWKAEATHQKSNIWSCLCRCLIMNGCPLLIPLQVHCKGVSAPAGSQSIQRTTSPECSFQELESLWPRAIYKFLGSGGTRRSHAAIVGMRIRKEKLLDSLCTSIACFNPHPGIVLRLKSALGIISYLLLRRPCKKRASHASEISLETIGACFRPFSPLSLIFS